MSIKQFIEKAIKGGWEKKHCVLNRYDHDELQTPMEFSEWYNISQILLDPLAWKAVGKVQWWDKSSTNGCAMQCAWWPYKLKNENQLTLPNKTYLVMNNESYSMWEYKMHRMIDALAEGKTIEQYLETL